MDPTLIAGLLAIVAVVAYFLFTKAPKVALAHHYRKFKIIEKTDISSNTRRFRLALQSPTTSLGLPVGDSVFLSATIDGQVVAKPYTPISSNDDLGFVDFCIKIYPNGRMTQHLDSLNVGDFIRMKGPNGSIQYRGAGQFRLGRTVKQIRHVAMVAGGSGITPMFQVMRAISKEHGGADVPTVSLIFGNQTEEDILLRSELEQMAKQSNIRVHFTLDKPPANWTGSKGFVTADMLAAHLPAASEDTLVLLCGPEPMVRSAERNLESLGHKSSHIKFF
jgi:cytochrome-b5 reductase